MIVRTTRLGTHSAPDGLSALGESLRIGKFYDDELLVSLKVGIGISCSFHYNSIATMTINRQTYRGRGRPRSTDYLDTGESQETLPALPPADLSDTSLTLPEAIRKYHAPEESTTYSVTLWGGAHFEGERECMNEKCPIRGKRIPVGELKFWTNVFGDGAWFFFCSEECRTEVHNFWYAKAHPQANRNEARPSR